MKDKVLLIVDMQNDFITGALANPAAEAIIPNIIKRKALYNNYNIFYSQDTHFEDDEPNVENQTIPPHCIAFTEGHAIADKMMKSNCSSSFFKYNFMADSISFGGKVYSDGGKDLEIEICGTCTEICVVSNALLLRRDYPKARIFCHANCCAGLTPEGHEAALKVMEACLIEVIR